MAVLTLNITACGLLPPKPFMEVQVDLPTKLEPTEDELKQCPNLNGVFKNKAEGYEFGTGLDNIFDVDIEGGFNMEGARYLLDNRQKSTAPWVGKSDEELRALDKQGIRQKPYFMGLPKEKFTIEIHHLKPKVAWVKMKGDMGSTGEGEATFLNIYLTVCKDGVLSYLASSELGGSEFTRRFRLGFIRRTWVDPETGDILQTEETISAKNRTLIGPVRYKRLDKPDLAPVSTAPKK
jgi:hypothetical protein